MIFAPKMSEIILEFESFELEPDPTPPAGVFCRYDRLEIWDGFPGGEQAGLGLIKKERELNKISHTSAHLESEDRLFQRLCITPLLRNLPSCCGKRKRVSHSLFFFYRGNEQLYTI